MKSWKKYSFIGAVSVAAIYAIYLLSKYVWPIISGLILGIMLSASASREIIQTEPSPGGTYEAYVLCVDAGAVGGDTFVYVKKVKDTGILRHKDKKLQSGRYGEEYDLVWIDDDTLEVNGIQKYEIDDIW